MTQAGDLKWRIGFYKRVDLDDGYGNVTSGYHVDPEFIVSAHERPKLGGEAVIAARLTGTNFVNLTIRQSSQSRLITTDWVAKDERSGVAYNIRSGPIDPDGKRQWFELLCEKGVAVGFMDSVPAGTLDFRVLSESGYLALLEDI